MKKLVEVHGSEDWKVIASLLTASNRSHEHTNTMFLRVLMFSGVNLLIYMHVTLNCSINMNAFAF